jgi:hypothetical protein
MSEEEPVWVLQHSKRESIIDEYDITEKIGEYEMLFTLSNSIGVGFLKFTVP